MYTIGRLNQGADRLGMETIREAEMTWGRVTSVWWLLTWRGLVGALLLGVIVGVLLGLGGAFFGFAKETVRPVSTLGASLLGVLWGLYVVRMALRKRYDGFRLALIEDERY